MVAYIPVLVGIFGAVIWGFASGKIAEVGRILFSIGALLTIAAFASETVTLFHR